MSRDQFQRLALVTILVLLATVASNRLMAYASGHLDHHRFASMHADMFDGMGSFEGSFDHEINIEIDGDRCRFDLDRIRAQADQARARAEQIRAQAEEARERAEQVRIEVLEANARQAHIAREMAQLGNVIRVEVN